MEGQQSACKLDSLIARIVQITTSDDAKTRLQIDHFILLVMMDRKAEIPVSNDQIESFESMFARLFKGSLKG